MNSSKKPLIALVDDDRNILMSMEELLKKEDFNIHTFSDGQSALNSFFKHPPDICLLYTSPSPRDLSTSRMPSSA